MRITFPTWGFTPAGGYRIIAELANGLASRGHEVTILTQVQDSSIERIFANRTSAGVCKAQIVRLTDMPASFAGQVKLLAASIPKSDAIVATFCLTAYPTMIGWARLRGKPFYLVQHYEPLFFSHPLLKGLVQATYTFPAKIAVLSQWLQGKLCRFARSPVVINPGVNHEVFRPQTTSTDEFTGIMYVHWPGVSWKGFSDLVEALRIAQLDQCKLVIVSEQGQSVGDLKLRMPVEEVRTPTDRDLASMYSRCDVFVSASWYEGFGLPPLEAMACGTPVVTTDSGGVRDFAINEHNALVVPPRSPTHLSRAIERVVHDTDLAAKLRRNGLSTSRLFTWEKTVNLFEKFLQSSNPA